MNINKPEDVLGLQILSSFMKKTLGDGPAFEIVLESLMKAATENPDFDLSGLSSNFLGENLNSLPLQEDSSLQTITAIKEAAYKSTNKIKESTSQKMKLINSAVEKYSKEFDVDSNLIHAIIKQESDYNPLCVSSAGAMGLMQLMPENCVEDGVKNPFDIEDNIRGGIKQLKGFLDKYKNIEMSLMAYNAGPGTVRRRGVTSLQDIYKMPKETQNYVKKVMNYYNKNSKVI